MHPVSCTNAHDVTDLPNHGMAKNTENLNIMRTEQLFSEVKKLTCASDDTFSRSYCFLAEATLSSSNSK